MSRLVAEEQRLALERWAQAADRYTGDLRNVMEGSLDPVEFGKGMFALAMTNMVRTAEGATRIGMSYSRWLAGLAGTRPATRKDTVHNTTGSTADRD